MPEAPRNWTRKIYTYLSTQNLEEKPDAIVSGQSPVQGESSRRSAAGSEARSKRVLELEHWASTRLQQWASNTGSKRKREREISRYWESGRRIVTPSIASGLARDLQGSVPVSPRALLLGGCSSASASSSSPSGESERERGLLLRDSRVLGNNGPAWPVSGWGETDDG